MDVLNKHSLNECGSRFAAYCESSHGKSTVEQMNDEIHAIVKSEPIYMYHLVVLFLH